MRIDSISSIFYLETQGPWSKIISLVVLQVIFIDQSVEER